jgi:RNA polymerase sigma-70 factor, ECF subfamily
MNKDEVFLNEAYIHYDYFKKIARRLTQNDFDAEDLVQDTFIRAYKFMDSFEPGSNCKAWLYRIMKNLFINFSRKKQAHPHYSIESVTSEPSASDADPVIRYYEIVKFMEKIKEEYRMVIMLYHLREFSLIEIAKALNWPLGTVKSRLHRARKEFRKVLTGSI